MKHNILIIDDDTDLSGVTADCLEDAGFAVSTAASPAEASAMIDRAHLILLDINLPGKTGFELCKQLRKQTKIPVIFISARTSDDDKIEGLDIGGDDYVPKPYSLRELLSRVNAHIRRNYPGRETFGNIEVDINGRKAWKNNLEINLSAKEFDLLTILLQHKNTVLAKDRLMREVWGEYSETEPATLTVHIRWLREKLQNDPSNPRYIKTAHRIGYMLEVPN